MTPQQELKIKKTLSESTKEFIGQLWTMLHNVAHGYDPDYEGEIHVEDTEKSTEKTVTKNFVSIFKSIDDEKRVVLGVVLVPGEADAHGDEYNEYEVEKAAHKFAAKGFYQSPPTLAIQHTYPTRKAEIVETYLTPTEMTLNGETLPKGTWMIATKINSDDLWADIKSGKFTGYSIGGKARYEELTND